VVQTQAVRVAVESTTINRRIQELVVKLNFVVNCNMYALGKQRVKKKGQNEG